MTEAERILSLIGEPDRLRVVAALALGASTPSDISRMTGVEARAVERALSRLVAGELVESIDGGYRLLTEDIFSAARHAAQARGPEETDPVGRYFRDGRLKRIPATRSKRAPVLDHIAQSFEPGYRYLEKEVNEILSRFHDDFAALRRYMVDEGFMDRESGYYWRTGGTFPID